ncbi:MAG: autotransporter-associated beta strand repeat-containing protein, partial [bacterium]
TILEYASSAPQVLSGQISGVGVLTKSGTGSLTLTGTNTYTGATTISSGALTVGEAGQLGSGNYVARIINSGAFTYASTATQTLSGVISGTGAMTQGGTGTLILSGANTYTGVTTISNGTLQVNGSTTGTVTIVKTGAILGGSGTVFGEVTVESGGHLAPGSNSAGTLTLSGTGMCLILTNNAVLDWEIGGGVSPINDTVNLTGIGSTIGFGTNATLNLARAPGVTGCSTAPIVMFQYNGNDPILPLWTINYGDTGCSRGIVVIDTDNKRVLLMLLPQGTTIIVR